MRDTAGHAAAPEHSASISGLLEESLEVAYPHCTSLSRLARSRSCGCRQLMHQLGPTRRVSKAPISKEEQSKLPACPCKRISSVDTKKQKCSCATSCCLLAQHVRVYLLVC